MSSKPTVWVGLACIGLFCVGVFAVCLAKMENIQASTKSINDARALHEQKYTG